MRIRQEKQIVKSKILSHYYNWTSQINFKELNTGCSGCGACSCSGGEGCSAACDYPCDCSGCSQCGMTIKHTDRILINQL